MNGLEAPCIVLLDQDRGDVAGEVELTATHLHHVAATCMRRFWAHRLYDSRSRLRQPVISCHSGAADSTRPLREPPEPQHLHRSDPAAGDADGDARPQDAQGDDSGGGEQGGDQDTSP